LPQTAKTLPDTSDIVKPLPFLTPTTVRLLKKNESPTPVTNPDFLPNFLHEKGITAIISGGMGGGAIDIFNEKQIAVVTGASGDASEAALAYAQGKLTSTGSVCNQHAHHEECGGH
jgi:Uncharacterized conserved protein